MSATSFLRHRRATAVAYISKLLEGPRHDAVLAILEGYNLTPGDLANLSGNTDVLSIADRLAADHLDEPELDSLEELNVLDVGKRAAVHGLGVAARQFEGELQHPAQETVGVGNMHDVPSMAAEDLANISDQHRIDAGGSLADAAKEKAADGKLAAHDGLPPAAPTSAPAGDQTAPVPGAGEPGGETRTDLPVGEQLPSDEKALEHASDPSGQNGGPETVVDLDQAAKDLAAREKHEAKLEKLGEDALLSMSRDQLLAYADTHTLSLTDIGERTQAKTIAKQIIAAQKGAE